MNVTDSTSATAFETARPEVLKITPLPEHFINRDISLLDFTARVVEEAFDTSNPLLERLKFLSIVSSNLDEFFMIRVSGLKERLGRETGLAPDGIATSELLAQIKERVMIMASEQARCLHEEVLPALEREGVVITTFDGLSDSERRRLTEHFEANIYPLLTPQAV